MIYITSIASSHQQESSKHRFQPIPTRLIQSANVNQAITDLQYVSTGRGELFQINLLWLELCDRQNHDGLFFHQSWNSTHHLLTLQNYYRTVLQYCTHEKKKSNHHFPIVRQECPSLSFFLVAKKWWIYNWRFPQRGVSEIIQVIRPNFSIETTWWLGIHHFTKPHRNPTCCFPARFCQDLDPQQRWVLLKQQLEQEVPDFPHHNVIPLGVQN